MFNNRNYHITLTSSSLRSFVIIHKYTESKVHSYTNQRIHEYKVQSEAPKTGYKNSLQSILSYLLPRNYAWTEYERELFPPKVRNIWKPWYVYKACLANTLPKESGTHHDVNYVDGARLRWIRRRALNRTAYGAGDDDDAAAGDDDGDDGDGSSVGTDGGDDGGDGGDGSARRMRSRWKLV